MAFKVGDRVVIVRSPYPERIGQVARIIGPTESGPRWAAHGLPHGTPMWILDIPSRLVSGVDIAYPPSHLERLPDDGHEKAAWTDELRRLCKVGKVES